MGCVLDVSKPVLALGARGRGREGVGGRECKGEGRGKGMYPSRYERWMYLITAQIDSIKGGQVEKHPMAFLFKTILLQR